MYCLGQTLTPATKTKPLDATHGLVPQVAAGRWLIGLLLIGAIFTVGAATDPALILRAKYASLSEDLRQNQFQQALVLVSTETPNSLQGDIYAVIDFPFDRVSVGLSNPDHWCDVMLLHINTKYCHAATEAAGITLNVNIGRKTPEVLSATSLLVFTYNLATTTPEYVEIVLNAQNGPFGTSDYRIRLELLALPAGKTFLHLSYSYNMNFAGRLAMKSYLETIGSDKAGFTVIGTRDDGQAILVGGVRGMIERNTMRYYLAIDSYLGALDVALDAQFEHRLQSWFAATERYPRQLNEMERADYLAMKRAEQLRQQAVR